MGRQYGSGPRGRARVSSGLAVGMALFAASIAGCGSKKEAAPAQPAAPAVVVAKVEKKTVPIRTEFVARTEAVATVEIVARVEGFLKEMQFKEGQPVKKDQVLYAIDPREYEANLRTAQARAAKAEAGLRQARERVAIRRAEAELEQEKARLEKAQQDVARYTPLAAQEAVPQQELDSAKAAEKVARANVDAAQAKLADVVLNTGVQIDEAAADLESARAAVTKAQLDLSYCTIRAPLDGLIGRTEVYPGNLVGRGKATTLNTLSALHPIQVLFAVSESGYLDFMKRKGAGASADVELLLADNSVYPQRGRIRMADRAVDVKTGTLSLLAEFPNPGGLLRPNQFGRIRMVTGTATDALLVPQKAVVEQQSTKGVYVVMPNNNTVALRTISLGPRYESFFVVTQGVSAGERVIVEGHQKARPGLPVVPTEQALTQEAGAK